jgi:hypothetical protein
MTLPDRPPYVSQWNTGLPPEMLEALGTLAVVSAQAEEFLHQIYWKHAGLDQKTGPIATDNLNPKRLEEDIKKLVRLDAAKANVLADLTVLFVEFEALNTKRNHCLHWIWEIAGFEKGKEPTVMISSVGPVKAAPYQLKRPIYRQTGHLVQEFDIKDVREICSDFSWLATRLQSHAISEQQLRVSRATVGDFGAIINPDGTTKLSFADLFWPAPWLDKPLQPNSTPLDHPETQK